MRYWVTYAWWEALRDWVATDGPHVDAQRAKSGWKWLVLSGRYSGLRQIEFRDPQKPRLVREYQST